MKTTNYFLLLLKGWAMGMAEAIPGVSGGTIAFITGIYEELLLTIKAVNPANIKLLFTTPRSGWKALNGKFIVWLIAGMGIGLIIGVLILSELLETHKEFLWSFFLGIVLASSVYFARQQKWDLTSVFLCLIALVLSYLVTTVNPTSGSENMVYVFGAGIVAVSALMLPGLSGSFILLLLGLYEIVIHSVKNLLVERTFDKSTLLLMVFGAGLITGLFSFARVLSWLFRKYHDWTMAFMIGILLGSLNKLWPWKLIISAFNKESGMIETIGAVQLPSSEIYKIMAEDNVLPSLYSEYSDPRVVGVLLSFVAGILLIGLMSRFQPGTNNTLSG